MAWPSGEGWPYGDEPLLVQGGAEGADERVLAWQSHFFEEVHDVERATEMRDQSTGVRTGGMRECRDHLMPCIRGPLSQHCWTVGLNVCHHRHHLHHHHHHHQSRHFPSNRRPTKNECSLVSVARSGRRARTCRRGGQLGPGCALQHHS